MHIPDGYLSPGTCAALYAAASPFWYISLKRARKLLNTRTVPLLSLAAAFSFVVMMFNLPLPGGTTGHAVGVGAAAIILGPWGSMLAISIALAIQAVFFGDGGVTALGANCFNIAIVGSLVSYVVYRAIAARASLKSSRHALAATIAGYIAINAGALLAAIEFGIQPALFHDASGAPLYAPYGLSVTIPAMMLGHLTIAGLAEAVLSGGIISYVQRTRPGLLARSGTAAVAGELHTVETGWRALRPVWLGLACLLLLTPLGVLAVGTAWGEWSAQEFASPDGRASIAAASGSQAPPAGVPAGLRRLSSLWTAPFPNYAPQVVKNEAVGYILSAMFGVGLIMLTTITLGRVMRRRTEGAPTDG